MDSLRKEPSEIKEFGVHTFLRPTGAVTTRSVFVATLAVLLVIDALFIGMHLVQGRLTYDPSYEGLFANNNVWSLGIDGSLSETYMYLKSGVAALILFILYSKRRTLTYLGWGLTLLFILVDDSLGLHEAFTVFMVNNASLPTVLNVEGEHYAALILWALVGLVLMGLIFLGYLREPRTRRLSRWFFLLLGVLFFCGGVVDALRESAPDQALPLVTYILKRTIIIEDGGEMVVLSFFVALALSHLKAQRTLQAV